MAAGTKAGMEVKQEGERRGTTKNTALEKLPRVSTAATVANDRNRGVRLYREIGEGRGMVPLPISLLNFCFMRFPSQDLAYKPLLAEGNLFWATQRSSQVAAAAGNWDHLTNT
jgi:hypothetical protein